MREDIYNNNDDFSLKDIGELAEKEPKLFVQLTLLGLEKANVHYLNMVLKYTISLQNARILRDLVIGLAKNLKNQTETSKIELFEIMILRAYAAFMQNISKVDKNDIEKYVNLGDEVNIPEIFNKIREKYAAQKIIDPVTEIDLLNEIVNSQMEHVLPLEHRIQEKNKLNMNDIASYAVNKYIEDDDFIEKIQNILKKAKNYELIEEILIEIKKIKQYYESFPISLSKSRILSYAEKAKILLEKNELTDGEKILYAYLLQEIREFEFAKKFLNDKPKHYLEHYINNLIEFHQNPNLTPSLNEKTKENAMNIILNTRKLILQGNESSACQLLENYLSFLNREHIEKVYEMKEKYKQLFENYDSEKNKGILTQNYEKNPDQISELEQQKEKLFDAYGLIQIERHPNTLFSIFDENFKELNKRHLSLFRESDYNLRNSPLFKRNRKTNVQALGLRLDRLEHSLKRINLRNYYLRKERYEGVVYPFPTTPRRATEEQKRLTKERRAAKDQKILDAAKNLHPYAKSIF